MELPRKESGCFSNNKQLNEVFVISRIIKVEVGVKRSCFCFLTDGKKDNNTIIMFRTLSVTSNHVVYDHGT